MTPENPSRQLAKGLKIPLPDRLAVIAPSASVPAQLADFVGAWRRTSPERKIRDSILIIEDVDETGSATGVYAVGPPKFNFLPENAPSYIAFMAPVTSDGVSFMWGPLKFTFNRSGDVMLGHFYGVDRDRDSGSFTLQRIE